MKTTHRIIIGDSRNMAEVQDESVHLVITSPPYWQLKDYGKPDQVGFNDTYEAYINHLNLVWSECARVLYPGCRLCVNIGDQFARSVYYGRYKVIPIRTEITKFCESAGFDYMGAVIWQKVTTCNTTGGATIMGSFPYPRNGILKIDYEFILIFKKYGAAPPASNEHKEASRLTTEEWNEYFAGHWVFPGEKQDKHLAAFPEELPRRLIRMFSFVGDTILDPFLGSGTTSLAAKNLNRNSIGYEINEEFLPIIKERMGLRQRTIFQDASVEILRQSKGRSDFQEKIAQLPYIFKDPTRFDKKVDPKRLQFGSKIDGASTRREVYYTVKDVLSSDKVLLSSGLTVRLLGVKSIPGKEAAAKQFLMQKAKGQKVFMKYDALKHDESNTLYCYLYLANKTFLNAHLIKSGLADVDTGVPFKYREKFISQRKAS